MSLDFKQRAQLLGHSAGLLDAGIPVSTTFTVNSPEDLKKIVHLLTEQGGNPDLVAYLLSRLPEGGLTEKELTELAGRVNGFLYNSAALSDADSDTIKGALPVNVQTTSATDYTPSAPVIVHTPGTIQVYNIGTLTLNQGIYFSFCNTPLQSFTVADLIRHGNSGEGVPGDFNILGVRGTDGVAGGNGRSGGVGIAGADGGAGSLNGQSGGQGIAGETGYAGTDGTGGEASQYAYFYINQSIAVDSADKPVVFYAQSGSGGNGGPGGDAGNGGAGGKGGNGAFFSFFGTARYLGTGGIGGSGGNGGNGGTGGAGGNAANANGNIVITVPVQYKNLIAGEAEIAPGGKAGRGGNYGQGGAGGAGGMGSNGVSSYGETGQNGFYGFPDNAGNNGTAASITIYTF